MTHSANEWRGYQQTEILTSDPESSNSVAVKLDCSLCVVFLSLLDQKTKMEERDLQDPPWEQNSWLLETVVKISPHLAVLMAAEEVALVVVAQGGAQAGSARVS